MGLDHWEEHTIPENPPPIITMSASDGRSGVLRKSLNGNVSAVQNEVVGFGTGARLAAIVEVLRAAKRC
jgi:hypothetical protein